MTGAVRQPVVDTLRAGDLVSLQPISATDILEYDANTAQGVVRLAATASAQPRAARWRRSLRSTSVLGTCAPVISAPFVFLTTPWRFTLDSASENGKT